MSRSKRMLSPISATLVALFVSVFLFAGNVSAAPAQPLWVNEEIIEAHIQENTQKLDLLSVTAEELQALSEKKQELQSTLEKEKAKIAELKKKIEDKRAAEAAAKKAATKVAQPTRTATPVSTGPIGNCGDNYYASYIYGMESGGRVVGNCDPNARNAGGCLGIGQACPGSKLLAVCPNLDYACQNSFFTNYALGRYGSWAAAYNFWLANHWW